MKKIEPVIIILFLSLMVLVGVLLYKIKIGPTSAEYHTDTLPVQTIVKVDTIVVVKTDYKPIVVKEYIIDTFYSFTPTDSLLKQTWYDYNVLRIYQDTLLNDSMAFFVIHDTIYRNSVYSRQWTFENRAKTIIQTQQVSHCKEYQWLVGLNLTMMENKITPQAFVYKNFGNFYGGAGVSYNSVSISLLYRFNR